MKLSRRNMQTVSFMLFSLFFGAGNLIFPPFLGQNAGTAAPAAMIGGVLGGMGIAMGSAEAERVVPVLTFYVGVWLLLFALLRAGRVLRFVSTSVMGGFISGICCASSSGIACRVAL